MALIQWPPQGCLLLDRLLRSIALQGRMWAGLFLLLTPARQVLRHQQREIKLCLFELERVARLLAVSS